MSKLILHTKFQPNVPIRFGEMDLNARVDVCFGGRRKYSNGHCNLIRFFFIWISVETKVSLRLHIKFQPTILSRSGENGDFITFGMLSSGGHLNSQVD